ncbi:MAG TPA: hypothetical protein VKV23_04740 [Acidimicrobiales bacterium]|nr:hypothetical protein [Acidimicrobiales bacterium]
MQEEHGAVPSSPHAHTILVDRDGQRLAEIHDPLWPPIGSVVEITGGSRAAIVTDVRLRLDLAEGSTSYIVVVLDEHPSPFEEIEQEFAAQALA